MLTAIPVNTPAYYEYAPCYAFERENNAVSREALTVSENISAARAAREYSQALFGVKDAALSQLAQLAEECREEDWDGSRPLLTNRHLLAASFIRALPDDLPLRNLRLSRTAQFLWIDSGTQPYLFCECGCGQSPRIRVDRWNRQGVWGCWFWRATNTRQTPARFVLDCLLEDAFSAKGIAFL